MKDFSQVKKGALLKLINAGAPGFEKNGELVRVVEVTNDLDATMENSKGEKCQFVQSCGADRLESTGLSGDFPIQTNLQEKQ